MGNSETPTPRSPTLADALRAALDPRTRSLLWFFVAWNLANGVISMFDDVHLLRNLGVGFVVVASRDATIAAMRIVCAPLWGRALDRAGARRVLVVCAFLLSLVPPIWLFATPGFPWPVALETLATGTLYAGFNLAAFALPLELAPRENRRFYLAAFSTAGGVAFATASAMGGLLAAALPTSFTLAGRTLFGLQMLFLIAGAGRAVAGAFATKIARTGIEARSAVEVASRSSGELRGEKRALAS